MLVLEVEGSDDHRLPFCCHLVASCREYQSLETPKATLVERLTHTIWRPGRGWARASGSGLGWSGDRQKWPLVSWA